MSPSRSPSLAHATLLVGIGTVASRLLGFARDVLIARLVGAGPVADAVVVALRLPNLARRMLGEGGLNAGFVPLSARIAQDRGLPAARRFAGEALVALALLATAVTLAVEIAAPVLIVALAPGLAGDPPQLALAATCLRLAFPFVAFVTVAALVAAVLNGERRFVATALASVAVNIVLVAALLLLARRNDMAAARVALWLAGLFSLSGLAQLVIVVAALLRLPERPRLAWPARRGDIARGDDTAQGDLARLVRLGVPALAASGTVQLVMLAATMVASFEPSAMAWLYYADRVFQLPLSFVGVGMGIVLLPALAAGGEAKSALSHGLNQALQGALALALPAAVALVVLATPIVAILFEQGAFSAADTRGSAGVLAGLALGLPGAVAGKVLSQGFFARAEARVPFLAGLLAVAVTLAVAAAARPWFGATAIAAAVALGLWAHGAMLALALALAGHWRPDEALRRSLPRFAGAALVMGAALYGLARLAAPALAAGRSTLTGGPALAALCLAGLVVYAATALALGATDRHTLAKLTLGG